MEHVDVALQVSCLIFQFVQFFWILLLLQLQLDRLSVARIQKQIRKTKGIHTKKKNEPKHDSELLLLPAHRSLSANASVTFFISVLKKNNPVIYSIQAHQHEFITNVIVM